jgi:hypothetical protein
MIIGILAGACSQTPYNNTSEARFTVTQLCPSLALDGHGAEGLTSEFTAEKLPIIRGYSANRPVALHGRQALVETADGGHVLLGNSYPGGYSGDALLMKISSQGKVEWANLFGGYREELCDALVEVTGGGYLVAGMSEGSPGKARILLFKTDGQGTLEWQRIYALHTDDDNSEPGKSVHGELHSIDRTSDGGYIVTGKSFDHDFKPGKKIGDVLVAKTDSAGSIEWIKTFGGNEKDVGNAVLQAADGGYVIVGLTNSFDGQEVLLMKLTPSGEVDWAKTYGQPAGDYGFDIIQTANGDLIIGGWTSLKSWGRSGHDILLFKTDKNGNIHWSTSYASIDSGDDDPSRPSPFQEYMGKGKTYRDFSFSLIESADGGIGMTRLWEGHWGFVLKASPDGKIEWARSMRVEQWGQKRPAWDYYGLQLAQSQDGIYTVAGNIRSPTEVQSIFIWQFDKSSQTDGCMLRLDYSLREIAPDLRVANVQLESVTLRATDRNDAFFRQVSIDVD